MWSHLRETQDAGQNGVGATGNNHVAVGSGHPVEIGDVNVEASLVNDLSAFERPAAAASIRSYGKSFIPMAVHGALVA